MVVNDLGFAVGKYALEICNRAKFLLIIMQQNSLIYI